MLLHSLSKFNPITAAGMLARVATYLDDKTNPAARDRSVDDRILREKILREVRLSLGVSDGDRSVAAIERVAEALDEASDRLIGITDIDATLLHLAEKGQLPSDLYQVEIVHNLRDFHQSKFDHESLIIHETVRAPDREQHFGETNKTEDPALLSLFAKSFSDKYEARGFTMLVVGQRDGMKLYVHQAWRIYSDLVDLNGTVDLVDMLRRFAERFGHDIELNGEKGNFIYVASMPHDAPASIRLAVEPTFDKQGRPRERNITVSHFVRPLSPGVTQHALCVAIDLDKYRKSLEKRGW